jgi:coenzyme F420 hydrogenase subunit beta
MYLGAVRNFMRANGFKNFTDIASLKYREGEWPGYLQIVTTSGIVLKAEKFYYNYLLPFYITRSTKYSVDFTNELTDISVGDAWHPKYEGIGKGFAVVLGRTEKGMQLLHQMKDRKVLNLEGKELDEVMDMHGHMLDFKKRGSFIRLLWRKKTGKPIPDYGYWPEHIPFSRKMVVVVISGIFILCSTTLARWVIRLFPIGFIGRIFNFSRKAWKNVSKPTKRKGLSDQRFIITSKS